MIVTPRFREHFYFKAVEPDTLFFFGAGGTFQFHGAVYVRLAALVDGVRTVSAIASLLKQDVRPVEILAVMNNLQKAGLVEEASSPRPTLPVEQVNGWRSLNLDADKLATAHIAVQTVGNVNGDGLIALLKSMSISVGLSNAPDITLDVVLTDDYMRSELEDYNRQATRPWLLIGLTSVPLLIGPIFQPNQTACYACLRQRMQLHRQVELFYAHENNVFPPYPATSLPASAQIAFGMTALAIAQWLTDPAKSPLVNTVRSVHPLTLEAQHHQVVKRPQCPVCGDSARLEAKPISLQNVLKVGDNDGGFRTATPAETIARYEHHISPVTGIAPYLQLVMQKGIAYTYTTGGVLSSHIHDWKHARILRHSSASGKGITEIQAKVSGLCEALERYSGVFEGNEPRIESTYADLADKAIHPNNLLHFSDRQYDARDEINLPATNIKRLIPMRFDPSREIAWTPVWSLMAHDWKYIPTAYCYYNYPQPPDYTFCYGDSNGNAAGGSMEDAIFQGFLELVERDAAALWWFNRLQRPGVELTGVDDKYIAQLKAYYQSIQREFWMLDLTSDLNIPVFCAVSRRIDRKLELPQCGFGAHLDPRIAFMRALSEMNQLLDPAKTMLAPEDQYTMTGSSIENIPCLSPSRTLPTCKISDYHYMPTADLLDDLNQCLHILQEQNLEMLVLDQTRPDVGLPVVKVIVPELRHFWPRFGQGRLYDVPIKMGWLENPLQEADLNPVMLSG